VNLDTLQELVEKLKISDITIEVMKEHGLAPKNALIKILGKGTLTAKVNVTANAFSESAKKAITEAQGTANII
jgi:large subunit ribosomal protein L15